MSFSIETKNSATIVSLQGGVLAKKNFGQLKRRVLESVDFRNAVIIDFGDIEQLDCAGLGVVVSFLEEANRAQGSLILCASSPQLRTLMEIVRIPSFARLFGSLHEAVDFCDEAVMSTARADHGMADKRVVARMPAAESA